MYQLTAPLFALQKQHIDCTAWFVSDLVRRKNSEALIHKQMI